MNHYTIGNADITWKSAGLNLIQDNYMSCFPSVGASEKQQWIFCFQEKRLEPSSFANAACLHRTGGYELLDLSGRLFLMNHWASLRLGYGFWLDELKGNNEVNIYVNSDMYEGFPLASVRFFSTIGLHSKFIQHYAPVLHGSYIEFRGKALVFSAPAGTGKSTQAELWRRYAGAQIINGDRVLLDRVDGEWNAFGYPCCGSSDICINQTCPLAAVVILEQGDQNRVEMLSLAQSVRVLVSATELYPWDLEEINFAFEIAQLLAQQVPIVKLICRPDEEAVAVLKGYLEQYGYI